MPRLENWSVVLLPTDAYTPPEVGPRALHGNVYDHEEFPDGTGVTTSAMHSMRIEEDTPIVTTYGGREYHLGTLDAAWEASYPNARKRFIDNWKDQR